MLENTSRDGRLDFDTALHQLIQANFAPRNASGDIVKRLTKAEVEAKMNEINMDEITQGYLTTYAVLGPNKQTVQWAIVDTQQVSGSPVTPLSRLLTMQDSFLISNMSYYLMGYNYLNGTYQDPDFSSNNDWAPITYASPWQNNGTGTDLDPGCTMFWIGSYIQLQVQKKVVIPYLDCHRFYYAPDTQATPGFPVPSNYIPKQKNKYDGGADGFAYVQPNIVIGGGRTNVFLLSLPANVPSTIAPFNFAGVYGVTFVLMAALTFRGILMQNSTTVK